MFLEGPNELLYSHGLDRPIRPLYLYPWLHEGIAAVMLSKYSLVHSNQLFFSINFSLPLAIQDKAEGSAWPSNARNIKHPDEAVL